MNKRGIIAIVAASAVVVCAGIAATVYLMTRPGSKEDTVVGSAASGPQKISSRGETASLSGKKLGKTYQQAVKTTAEETKQFETLKKTIEQDSASWTEEKKETEAANIAAKIEELDDQLDELDQSGMTTEEKDQISSNIIELMQKYQDLLKNLPYPSYYKFKQEKDFIASLTYSEMFSTVSGSKETRKRALEQYEEIDKQCWEKKITPDEALRQVQKIWVDLDKNDPPPVSVPTPSSAE